MISRGPVAYWGAASVLFTTLFVAAIVVGPIRPVAGPRPSAPTVATPTVATPAVATPVPSTDSPASPSAVSGGTDVVDLQTATTPAEPPAAEPDAAPDFGPAPFPTTPPPGPDPVPVSDVPADPPAPPPLEAAPIEQATEIAPAAPVEEQDGCDDERHGYRDKGRGHCKGHGALVGADPEPDAEGEGKGDKKAKHGDD